MSTLFKTILVSTAILLTSCSAPLSIEKEGEVLSEHLELKEDILFLSYCDFGELEPNEESFEMMTGIISVTSSELTLVGGNMSNLDAAEKIVIPIDSMRSVGLQRHGAGRQIQIKLENSLILIGITKSRAFVDQEGSDSLLNELTELGVDRHETEKFYFPKAKAAKLPFILPIWLLF